jgi:hypothetical protein
MAKTTSPQQSKGAAADRHNKLEAGITGGGIGTAIVGFAGLIQDSFWKQCVTLAAPSIGIIAAALYSFASRMYITPLLERMTINRTLNRYKILLENPALSSECQALLKKKLEEEIVTMVGQDRLG